MKICDIVQFYSPLSGGVKRYIRDKMRFIGRDGALRHCVIVPSDRDRTRIEKNSTVHEIASPRLPGSRSYRMLVARAKILDVISQEAPDVIEVGDPYRAAWIGIEAGERHRIPVVAFYHSDYPRALGRTIQRFAGSLAERSFSRLVSRYLVRLYNCMDATFVPARRLVHELEKIGIRNLVHVPLGTDTDRFSPCDSRERIRVELGIAPDVRLLLFSGRLAREKNIRSLIGMMDRLRQAEDRYHLLIIGDGELSDLVLHATRNYPDITHIAYIESPETLAEYYSAADLFVHAGTCETFGLVAAEAQACGTRVLGVEGGGLEEVTEGEIPAVMAKGPEPDALAKAVIQVFRIGETAEKRHARIERMRSRYDSTITFDRLFRFYRAVAERSHEFLLEKTIENDTDTLCHQAVSPR